MQRLNQDIKEKNFKPVYLLYGEEAYLIKQYKDRLMAAVSSDGDSMNVHRYVGKDVETKEIISLAETLPFLAQYRVILLENTGWLKKGNEELLAYLPNLCDSTILILAEQEVDRRVKLFDQIKKQGRCVEFQKQTDVTLQKWILGILKKENKSISQQTLLHFLETVGEDMDRIRSELEKLLMYTYQKESISIEDVDSVCVRQVQNQIFDMIQALADRNQQKALDLYYDLLSLKEKPMKIIALIGRQFNLMLQIKELQRKGYDKKGMSEKTGLREFLIPKYAASANRFSGKELRQALEECVELETAVKTGQLKEALSVEILLVKYSKKGQFVQEGEQK